MPYPVKFDNDKEYVIESEEGINIYVLWTKDKKGNHVSTFYHDWEDAVIAYNWSLSKLGDFQDVVLEVFESVGTLGGLNKKEGQHGV